MSKKFIYLVLLLAFCMTSSMQAANIIWVSGFFDDNGDGEPDDQAWVDMLEARGYTVDYTPGWEALDDDKIISRKPEPCSKVGSGYRTGKSSGQGTLGNCHPS